MATDKTITTRRAVIAALAGTPILAGTIGAALADTPEAPPLPDRDGSSFEDGEEAALTVVAVVWIDRWRAAGGDFGHMLNRDGTRASLLIGSMSVEFWRRADEGSDRLPPHLQLTDDEHQSGALRVLESMLTLVPGLRERVRALVEAAFGEA